MSHQCSDDLTFPAYVLPSNQGHTRQTSPLSSFTVSAPARGCIYYGESNRWIGVDQVNVLKVTADTCADVETRRCCGGVVGRLLVPALAGFLAVRVAMA